jgi:hypothetical protein
VAPELTLSLGPFGRTALERLSAQGNGSPAKAVRAASLYYLGDRGSERPAWRVPDLPPPDDGDGALRVELDDETWSELCREAERQGVTPGLLAVHALLYFVADVDSGRVDRRLGDALAD